MGKFIIKTRGDAEFQFSLISTNGQTVLNSEGYTTKAGCENGIILVKNHSKDDANFEKKTAINGKHYFNLRSSNKQVIGSSEMYDSTAGRDNGIASVQNNAPAATVDDQTLTR